MHPYAQNAPHQPKLIAVLALISAGLASLLWFASSFIAGWLGITVAPLSALAIFAGLWWLFDTKLWRHRWLCKLLLIPDLNGTWTCRGTTHFKNGLGVEIPWEATVTLVQSWSKMRVILKTSQSSSRSLSASLHNEPGEGFRLTYHYGNDPRPGESDLARHYGVANLLFTSQAVSAEGLYFTDKDRMTYGSMFLTKEITNE